MKCRFEKAENWDKHMQIHSVATFCYLKARFECSDKIRSQGIVDYILNEDKKVVNGHNPRTCFYIIDASLS
jgi:hypothetical protein